MGRFVRAVVSLLFLLVLPHPVFAAVTTEILSVKNDGTPVSDGDRHAWTPSAISNDGRYVVFNTRAGLVGTDTDGQPDIYLRDRLNGTTTLLTPPGFYPGDAATTTYMFTSISGDGNHVALYSSRFVTSVGNVKDLLLIDRASGTVEMVKAGVTFPSRTGFAVDYDGDVYYFDDYDTYTGGVYIYKYDRQAKVTTLLYASSAKMGAQYHLSVDDAGMLVCFAEGASSFTDLNVYLMEVATGNRTLVSKAADGSPAGSSTLAKISKDGSTVAFHSRAANLGASPYPTLYWNLFLYDVGQQTVEKVDFIHPQYGYLYPTQNLYNVGVVDVSDNGRHVAAVLTTDDYSSHQYGAILDRQTGTVSFLPDGMPRDNMLFPVISPDGRYVVSTGVTPLANGVFVLLYDLSGGNPAFAVEAGADQVVEQESASGSYVTLRGELVTGSCSEGTFRWTWAEGETVGDNPTVLLPSGVTLVTLDWTGCDSTATDSLMVTVQDTLAPTADAVFVGISGQNGWYLSAVAASLSAEDAGSGIRELRYRLDGGAEAVYPGTSATVAINGDGEHTLDFHAVDQAGNSNSPQSVAVRIDTVAPQAGATLSGQTTNAGLYVSEVCLTLTATDGTSGVQLLAYRINEGDWQTVAGAATTVMLNTDGGYQVDFHAVDAAGNSSTPQTLSLVIDKTQLSFALVENLQDMVMAIALEAFSGNNPNDADKLALEISKILEQLADVGNALTPAEKIQLYEWARKKLEEKLAAEIDRMITDPSAVQLFAAEIGNAIAAIDAQITQLRGQP